MSLGVFLSAAILTKEKQTPYQADFLFGLYSAWVWQPFIPKGNRPIACGAHIPLKKYTNNHKWQAAIWH